MQRELVNKNQYGDWIVEYLTIHEDGTGVIEKPRFGSVGMLSSRDVENAEKYMQEKLVSMKEDGYNVIWE